MSTIEVTVPDIGDFDEVPVIEVLVKPGDTVQAEDSLVTLESDKATMDVPSPGTGVVKSVAVNVGDKVKQGSSLVVLETDAANDEGQAAPEAPAKVSAPAAAESQPPAEAIERAPRGERGERGFADIPGEGPNSTPPAGATMEVEVPDIGDFDSVPVIEVHVKPGDIVKVDDSLVTLESDKATMDVPSPHPGVVEGVRVSVGDRVGKGTVILTLSRNDAPDAQPAPRAAAPAAAPPPTPAKAEAAPTPPAPAEARPQAAPAPEPARTAPVDSEAFRAAHASPSVRKFARELGVDLGRISGSGPSGRILHEDVQRFVKQALSEPAAAPASATGTSAGLDLLPWPKVDFAKFGPVESKPLSRIRKISGANLARNWVMIPHVTQFDEADVTDLEALRVQLNQEHEKAGIKFTMLAFLIKACVAGLAKFPDFNASLDGDNLVYKKYVNIGFAADTPNGLVVPVIKGADGKGLSAIAKEMAELSAKAREGKLAPGDMQGGCFSISSLGGIGGTAFTPIINAPEVAILGVSKAQQKPVWNGSKFKPRLMLPLSLSYDHRVIDGAQAARFSTFLVQVLADFRRVLL